jgi:hypothetical protein
MDSWKVGLYMTTVAIIIFSNQSPPWNYYFHKHRIFWWQFPVISSTYRCAPISTDSVSTVSVFCSLPQSLSIYPVLWQLSPSSGNQTPFLRFSIDLVLNFSLSWLRTPSICAFLGCPLFRLSCGTHSKINFGILSLGILLMWPYHCSTLFSQSRPQKKLKNRINKQFISFKMRAKWERTITWRNPAARTCPSIDYLPLPPYSCFPTKLAFIFALSLRLCSESPYYQ